METAQEKDIGFQDQDPYILFRATRIRSPSLTLRKKKNRWTPGPPGLPIQYDGDRPFMRATWRRGTERRRPRDVESAAPHEGTHAPSTVENHEP